MSDWMTDALIAKAKKYNNLTREDLAEVLGVTEYKVRELRREIRRSNNGPTIAVFDLETTDLKADFGRLLCGSVLSYPSNVMSSFRIDEHNAGSIAKDGPLAVAIRDEIEKHHISAGYYSKGFDISFLNTRLMVNGERKMTPMLHIDPIWFYRGWRGANFRSSKMKVVAKVLGLEETKMDVPDEVWIDARHGDKASLDILVDRCESDVRITMDIIVHALDNRLMKSIQT
jgi:uncharacterized protein YprB with RNaseH-like and TPR domain